MWSALAMLGVGALKGLMGYKEKQEQYKINSQIAAYKNEINRQEYALNSDIITYNESVLNEDFLIQVMANDKQEMVDKGSLSVAQNFEQRGGNSAKLVEDSISASYASQEAGLTRTYEQKMQDIIFDRAKAKYNYLGGQTWMPEKPSLFNNIVSGLLGNVGSAIDEFYKNR